MLIKSEYNLIMNHKKVLRLMKKYDLLSIIRKKDPYSKIRLNSKKWVAEKFKFSHIREIKLV